MRQIIACLLTLTAVMGLLFAGSEGGPAVVNLTGLAMFAISAIAGAIFYG